MKAEPPAALHFPTTTSIVLPVPISDARVGDLSIGDLAAITGIPRDGLRFYEARGLIRTRRRGNDYRAYPPEIAELMQYMCMVQQLGSTLVEIKEGMSHVWQQPDTDAAVTVLLRDELATIDARVASLQAMRNVLATRVGMACPLASA